MLKCSKCGIEMPDSAKFCPQCGSRLVIATPPQETSKNSRGCLIDFLIVIALCIIVGINSDVPVGNATLDIFIPCIIVVGAVVGLVFTWRGAKENTKWQKQREDKLKAQGISIRTAFNHVSGLPVAENIVCKIFSYDDKIVFKSGTTTITLQRNKITDMCISIEGLNPIRFLAAELPRYLPKCSLMHKALPAHFDCVWRKLCH